MLALAAFNLFFRLGAEIVSEWDESIYALTAAEMFASGDWIGTTFNGALDYYNTKPPLQVWLITLSFKAFGVGLVPLRLVSAVAAWLTVGVLMWWARRLAGAARQPAGRSRPRDLLCVPPRTCRAQREHRRALHPADAA